MLKRVLPTLVLSAAGLAAALPCAAAKPPANDTPAADLTVPVKLHRANCPPPVTAPCVIRKPVGSGYRVLTPDVSVEDNGDRWVIEFGKKAAKSIRVLDMDGGLHEIEISFAARARK